MQIPGSGVDESASRAALYGVLAHLFIAPPSVALIQCIIDSEYLISRDGDPELSGAWQNLVSAARGIEAEGVAGEFKQLFVSTGRPAVSLYASSYTSGVLRGNQLLAALRDDLLRQGYARAEGQDEFEDHFSALCDVMRGLVADGNPAQQDFFGHYFEPWFKSLCFAIEEKSETVFYRCVANFARAFFIHESRFFELD